MVFHTTSHIAFSEMLFHFVTPLENAEAFPNETVSLSCEVSEPGREVTWLRDNVPPSMADDSVQIISNDCTHSLVIPQVTPTHAGEYTILCGEAHSTSVLTVHGKFQNSSEHQNQTISVECGQTQNMKYLGSSPSQKNHKIHVSLGKHSDSMDIYNTSLYRTSGNSRTN